MRFFKLSEAYDHKFCGVRPIMQESPIVRGQSPLLILLLLVMPCGCAAPRVDPVNMAESEKWIYVVGHGWHTGIVVQRADIPAGIWPEQHDFPNAIYLEAGWGDQAYYQAPNPTSGLALKAVLKATPSVLHMVGFRLPVVDYYPYSEIIEVGLSQKSFVNLTRFIHQTLQRDVAGRATYVGRGHTGNSAFYLATEKYHLFNTCNNWTAKALKAAGSPIRPAQAITAGNVMRQTRKFGRVIRVPLRSRSAVPKPSHVGTAWSCCRETAGSN